MTSEIVKMPPSVAIDRRNNLYVTRYNGSADRFAKAFRSVWKQIPLGPRRGMLRHWRTDEMRFLSGFIHPSRVVRLNETIPQQWLISPSIEILPPWWIEDGRDDDMNPLRGVMGAACRKGHSLKFHDAIVDALPDNLLADLIAHELAHVWQESIGLEKRFGFEPEPGDLEQDADEIMEHWGFSAEAIDEWTVEQGITKRVECSSIQEAIEWTVKYHRYWERRVESDKETPQ